MKYLLIPLAFVATTAVACPGDAAKSAAAPHDAKATAAAKAAPSSTSTTSVAASKMVTKVAVKPVTEVRKPTSM